MELTDDQIKVIAVNIAAYRVGNHGDFLTLYFAMLLHADYNHFTKLREFTVSLIEEYRLSESQYLVESYS